MHYDVPDQQINRRRRVDIQNSQRDVIRPIQYLRGLAAMMVVWHHSLGQVPNVEKFLGFSDFGVSGVDLFFVISGFIMVVTTAGKDIAPRDFFVLRIVRVVPLYWLMTLLMVACALVLPGMFKTLRLSVPAVVQSLLFIPYDSLSFPGHAWPVLVPGWTLNYEMYFYALFALSIAAPRNMRLVVLVTALAVVVLVGLVFGPFSRPLAQTYTNPILLEFASGAIIAHRWICGSLRIGIFVSVAAALTGFWLLVTRDSAPLQGYTQIVGAALMVAGSLHPIMQATNSRTLLAIGNASYSIYLTHLFTLGGLRTAWVRIFPEGSLLSSVCFMVFAMSFCAIGGWFCYRFVEQPMTRRLRGLVRGGRNTQPAHAL
jgi:exopolysaccharide production protein ExoZ